jgi:hypothetical protein
VIGARFEYTETDPSLLGPVRVLAAHRLQQQRLAEQLHKVGAAQAARTAATIEPALRSSVLSQDFFHRIQDQLRFSSRLVEAARAASLFQIDLERQLQAADRLFKSINRQQLQDMQRLVQGAMANDRARLARLAEQ